LLVQFQGMIAEYERAQIMERTRRGKRYRAKAGGVGGLCTPAYGYRYEPKTEQAQAYLVIHEAEAEMVRRIFELYTQERWSVRQIAEHLNQERVPTRSGKPWQPSTLWGMLRNSAYQGRAYYGKTRNCERQKVTKASRQKGGFCRRRHTSSQRVETSQWIEIGWGTPLHTVHVQGLFPWVVSGISNAIDRQSTEH
jgi:site-specific DNA recombinase